MITQKVTNNVIFYSLYVNVFFYIWTLYLAFPYVANVNKFTYVWTTFMLWITLSAKHTLSA